MSSTSASFSHSSTIHCFIQFPPCCERLNSGSNPSVGEQSLLCQRRNSCSNPGARTMAIVEGNLSGPSSVLDSFDSLPFLQLRRPGEFVDRRSPPPVLVPGLTLVFERRVRHVAGPLLNSDRCGPSAPPWTPIYRCPYSLATSEAFAVQTLCVWLDFVDPPLSALAALPETLLHGRP